MGYQVPAGWRLAAVFRAEPGGGPAWVTLRGRRMPVSSLMGRWLIVDEGECLDVDGGLVSGSGYLLPLEGTTGRPVAQLWTRSPAHALLFPTIDQPELEQGHG